MAVVTGAGNEAEAATGATGGGGGGGGDVTAANGDGVMIEGDDL